MSDTAELQAIAARLQAAQKDMIVTVEMVRDIGRLGEIVAQISRALQPNAGEDWTKALACVMNNLRECLARTPRACICRQMPFDLYRDALIKIQGVG